MNWFLIALIAPILWSITNHLDKYLISRFFKGGSIGALMIFSAIIGFLLLPVIFFIDPNVINLKLSLACLLIANGALYIVGLLPYFYALEKDEASIVVPLFQLIPIFSYVLALIILDEHLTTIQVIASLLIIVGAVLISIENNGGKQKFKTAVFWLMTLSSFLIALNGLIFKHVAIQENFWVTSFWEYVGIALFAIFLLFFVKSYRKQFLFVFKNNKIKVLTINGANEVINILAKLSMSLATLLAPLALAWVVNGFQPFFVLFFGILLATFFPKLTNESLNKKFLIQKLIAIIIMFIGVYLIY